MNIYTHPVHKHAALPPSTVCFTTTFWTLYATKIIFSSRIPESTASGYSTNRTSNNPGDMDK